MRRWLTRTVLLLSVVSLCNDIASELLYPVLPLYLASIGYGAFWIGLLEGIAEAVAGLTKGWFGEWSDRRGVRLPFVRTGYFLSALSKPLLPFFPSVFWTALMRSSDKLGKGIRTGARDALLADEVDKAHRGKVFGFHRAFDTVGAVIGPSIALLWLYFHKDEEFKRLFMIALWPGIASILLLFFVREHRRKPVNEGSARSPFSSFFYWKRAAPEYRKLVSGILLFTLFNSSDMFLLLLVKTVFSSGVSFNFAGWHGSFSGEMLVVGIYIFYNIVYAAFSYPAGFLSDKIGPKQMLIAGYFFFALTYGGMALAALGYFHSIGFLLGCFVVYGMYAACSEGISKAWVSVICRKEDKGVALGLFSGLTSIATLIASLVAGVIWSAVHPSAVFLSAAIVAAVTIFYLSFFTKAPAEHA